MKTKIDAKKAAAARKEAKTAHRMAEGTYKSPKQKKVGPAKDKYGRVIK